MASITLRVLDGADRGRIFQGLNAPVTVGREEGNDVQLNDERISRFHLKIQEDQNQFVLTDLDSTNGTKVNGDDASLRVLRFGDVISLGRSVLLFGSRKEIAERLLRLQSSDPQGKTLLPEDIERRAAADDFDFEENWADRVRESNERKAKTPPGLPELMTPLQSAQLCELLEFLHLRLRRVLAESQADVKQEHVSVELLPWQNLVDLQWRLAEYIRAIAEPKYDD